MYKYKTYYIYRYVHNIQYTPCMYIYIHIYMFCIYKCMYIVLGSMTNGSGSPGSCRSTWEATLAQGCWPRPWRALLDCHAYPIGSKYRYSYSTYIGYHRPKSKNIGSTVRPRRIPYGYMDPLGMQKSRWQIFTHKYILLDTYAYTYIGR